MIMTGNKQNAEALSHTSKNLAMHNGLPVLFNVQGKQKIPVKKVAKSPATTSANAL
jgi:hypothetical protein